MSLDNSERTDFYDDLPTSKQPHRGVMNLVLGILNINTCGFLGIFAWLLGKRDLELMRQGLMDKEGELITKVGYILGIIGTVLFMLWLMFAVLYFVFIIV